MIFSDSYYENEPILLIKNIIYILKYNVEVNYFGDVILVHLYLHSVCNLQVD